MKRLYTYLAARLVRAIVAWCTARKRFVDYVHETPAATPSNTLVRREWLTTSKHTYMRRYVLFGFRTGDPPQTGLRAYLPNLYLHHMHAPDADECLHDHPWPWGLSFVLLGGYREERVERPIGPEFDSPDWVLPEHVTRTHNAPALNWIPGTCFHRVAALETPAQLSARGALWFEGSRGRWAPEGGTWTLFLAGPRRRNKGWGYLVSGRGYVPQQERHAELGASEVRP